MLDQPILSFKNMNSAGSTSKSADTNTGESEVATNAINNTENTGATHKFSEILKETQGKMNSENSNTEDKPIALNVSEVIKTDLSNEIDLPAVIATNSETIEGTLNNALNINSKIDLNLAVDNSNVDSSNLDNISTVIPVLNTDNLIDSTEDNIAIPSLAITIIKPVDPVTIENKLSPLLPPNTDVRLGLNSVLPTPLAADASVLTETIKPLSNIEQAHIPLAVTTQKPNTTINLPQQSITTLSNLTSGVNKGPFMQQLDEVMSDSLIDNNASTFDIDMDMFKSLGLSTQAPLSNQTIVNSPNSTPLTVTIPFQQAQWGTAVAEKVMWLNNNGLQEAEIQLDPPELGPLQVKISVENDQAHVSFVVQHSNVKDALEQTATRLREMFEAEGIDLVDVDVSDQSAQQEQEQEQDEELANTVLNDIDSNDEQTQRSDEALATSYINSPNGIDAYV